MNSYKGNIMSMHDNERILDSVLVVNPIVVRATCPKCGEYYELDCELDQVEIVQRNTGLINCPLCQEGIGVEDRRIG